MKNKMVRMLCGSSLVMLAGKLCRIAFLLKVANPWCWWGKIAWNQERVHCFFE